MNKQDIIEQLAASEDLPENEVEAVVDELLHLVEQRMKKGEETRIYGFGKFGVRWWRGRAGRDPQTGEEIEIEGRWMPYWSPSPTLIEEESPEEAPAAKPAKAAKPAAGATKTTAAEESKDSPEKQADHQNGQSGPAGVETPAAEQPETPAASGPGAKASAAETTAQKQAPEQEQPREPEEQPEPDRLREEVEEPPETHRPREPVSAADRKDSTDIDAPEEESPAPDRQKPESLPSPEPEEGVRPIGADEAEPDWQDIGDEISMKELRFISRQLEEAPEESGAGLFFFDEEEPAPSEPEAQEPPEVEKSFSAEDRESVPLFSEEEETAVEEPPREEPGTEEEPEELEWAMMERKRGKLGWVTILLLSFALVAFGSYTLLQDHLPQFPSFLSEREKPVEPRNTGPSPAGDAGNTVPDDQGAAQPANVTPESSTETPSAGNAPGASGGAIAPYDFGRARRANFLVIYTTALDSFQADRYQPSQRILERLLASNPPGDYVDNIHYWLGECQFAQARYRQAVRQFEMVFESSVTNKAEDALIMMAKAYLRLGEMNQAREILVKFRTQYPNSQYTDLANQWLQEYNLLAAGRPGTE